jgi:CheY-like chemotaxis protein
MAGKPIILIVDDEPLNLDYLEQGWKTAIEIITAINGKTALEMVAAHLPDVIFLDIMMPVMDGFEVLRRLKASVSLDIPVVIISAATNGERGEASSLERSSCPNLSIR